MDYILAYHGRECEKDPSGWQALEAIRTLREILGRDWEPDPKHPLRARLAIFSEPEYRWLIHFVMKLKELMRITGHDHVLERLRTSHGFSSAYSEMDIALRLKLAGHECKFAFERGERAPDLLAEIAGQMVAIEITSLNQPYEDTAGIEALHFLTTLTIQGKCRAGGVWSRPPRPEEFEDLKMKAREAVTLALTDHKVIRLNIPGLLTLYIAPEDLSSQIPQMWQGSSVMRTSTTRPKKDRIASRIQEKMNGQLSGSTPSIVVIYDRFSTPDEASKLFNEKELELVVGGFENLAGVLLISTFSAWDSPPSRREDKDGRTFMEYSLPDGEVERCVVWKNIMVDHRSTVESMVECLINSPRNITALFA